MSNKKGLVQKLENQIADWKCEMTVLEEKPEGAGEDANAKCCEAMDALRCQCQEGEAKLEEWKAKADNAWEDFQQEAEESQAAV